MILGITGKVGSGKTACTEFLEKEYNAKVFSCDKIAKEIIENKITDYIPISPIDFFNSDTAKEECKEKIHPLVFNRIIDYINKLKKDNKDTNENNNKLLVIECALPNETFYDICDKVIYIENSFDDKIKLLKNKRGYSEEITKLIYNSQKYYDKYYKKADFIITNDTTKNELEKKIKEVVDEIYFIRK